MARRFAASRTGLLLVIVALAFLYWYTQDSEILKHGADHTGKSLSADRPIAMISMTTRETSYDHIAISNKFLYAEKHGYHLRYDFWSTRGVWDKLTDVERAIHEKKYDWIWWLDNDVLITNTSVKLEHVIDEALAGVKEPEKIDLIVTPDCFPLNAGSMLFRSTPWVLQLFAKVWECGKIKKDDGGSFNEQDCIRDMIKDNIVYAKDKSVTIKQWKMNAFPEEIPCYDDDRRHWEEGMFTVHFAGAWAHVKGTDDATGDLMRKYSSKVVE